MWDHFGNIVDAVVNLPGSFHDSRAAMWGDVYNHILELPTNYKVVCDIAFQCTGHYQEFLLKQSTSLTNHRHKTMTIKIKITKDSRPT